MRIFADMYEAASEIKRDISKSPAEASASVQGIEGEHTVQEAMFYSYTLKDIPPFTQGLVGIAEKEKLEPHKDEVDRWLDWIDIERRARLRWMPGIKTERAHPSLSNIVRDETDYTYSDRLAHAVPVLAEVLGMDTTTRRAFWSIWNRDDVYDIPRDKRIPCSIGYQFLIRDIGGSLHLHMVYLQRSCDFERFWLSDVWLAREFQRAILERLNESEGGNNGEDFKLGYFTHYITSLHMFVSGEEIY